jgi:hypothetical protein
MLKAITVKPNGRTELLLGLSFENLDRLRAMPGDDYIRIPGQLLGLPIDIVIYSGRDEAHLTEIIAPFIDARTKVEIDPRLRQ